jgi:hypothetical protein
MSKRNSLPDEPEYNSFHFNLTGLTLFSLALVAGSSFLTYAFTTRLRPAASYDTTTKFGLATRDKDSVESTGPWGDLQYNNIELERPDEYLSAEATSPEAEKWMFAGMKADAVKALLGASGLPAGELTGAFRSDTATETAAGTEFRPPEDFVIALSPDTRQKLFAALAWKNVNLYFDYPFVFPADTIQTIYADPRLNADDVALLKKLVYTNGPALQLTDYPTLIRKIPTAPRRVAMARVLSRQTGVMAQLRITPDTDIDKIAAYWGHVPNVHFTDIRPLMESMKQQPDGGSVSLMYLLPKFARERLYTFPQPSQPGDPIMDCHWSTFNFTSDTPDNRLNDPNYAIQFIRDNYYNIAAPSICGDVLLLMNDREEVKHSAVYLADDLVFTKNGNNYSQPWMIMHIHDLLSFYPANPPMKAVYMRRRVD